MPKQLQLQLSIRRALMPSIICFMVAPAALADDAKGSIESVTVVGQKQPYRGDTPLQELPQAVQVLSADLLSDLGAIRLESALDLASGVARQNSFGGLWDSFAIRGFAGDENLPSGYLVNGFSAGRGFSGRRDSSNIQSIEVLKGPGSALYGRSEPGGTVNLITKKPLFESEGSVEVAAGSYDTYRIAADYTGPITDSIAFRINGAYDDADSFRDHLYSKKSTVSPSLLVRFSDATTLSYELELVDQEAPFDRGVLATFDGDLGIVPESRFLGEPNDGPMKIKANGHQLVLQHEFNSDWSLLTGIGYRNSTFKGFSSDAELTQSRQLFWTTGQIVSRQRRFRDYEATDKSARAELTGRFETGSLVHHVLLGADYYDFELDQIQNRFRPPTVASGATAANSYGLDVFNPVYGQTAPALAAFVSTLEEQDAYGIYVQDQIDLSEQWKMLLGVRFDDFNQELTNRRTGVTTKQSPTATSPRVGLVYEVTPLVSVYASFSKGFRPNSGSDVSGAAFEPEKSKSYEVGTKLTAYDGRINGTIAVFKAEKTNVLTSDPVNSGFSIAAGEAESKGVEIDVSGQLTDDLQASFSYAYIDAETTVDVLDFNFAFLIPAGSPLLNIPKNSANLLVIQDFHSSLGTFSVGTGVNYIDERLGETGVPDFQLPSYTLVKLITSYAPTEQLKFSFDVDNLFDKTYYPSSYSRLWVMPGIGRNYTGRVQYKF